MVDPRAGPCSYEAGTMPPSSFAIIADVSHADEVGDAVNAALRPIRRARQGIGELHWGSI